MIEDPPHPSEHPDAQILSLEEARDRLRSSRDDVPPPADGDIPPMLRASDRDARPQIILTSDQPAIVGHAERVLRELGVVYVRGRALVRVVRDRGGADWLKRPAGAPVITNIERDHLLELLGRAAQWVTINGKGEARTVQPPVWIAAMLLARGEWSLPQLEGISDAPVLRADGTVLEVAGYDQQTRIIYEPCGATFPPVAANPTQASAAAALAQLAAPFVEFPFVADSDRSAAVALVLSLIARPAISGNVPMFASCAPTPGSGKGLLVDVAAMIATGRRAPLMPPCDSDEEMRKRLLALAVESPQLVVIDNVEGAIGSPSLAMALTAGQVTDRVLGHNRMATATLRPVWCVTGNNVQLKGDLGRRVVPIDLDPRVEHPEDRVFQRGNLLAFVEKQRPDLVAASLTILRAFVVADCPPHGMPAKGSFEEWDRLVRGAIIWAGGADPLGGVQRIRDRADDDLSNLRTLLAVWLEAMGKVPSTLSEVVKRAGDGGDLRDALGAFCRDGRPNTKTLGYVLRRVQGRVVAGMMFDRAESDRNGVTRWKVVSQ